MARSRGTGLNGRGPRGRNQEGLAAAPQRRLAPARAQSESDAGTHAGVSWGDGGVVRLPRLVFDGMLWTATDALSFIFWEDHEQAFDNG